MTSMVTISELAAKTGFGGWEHIFVADLVPELAKMDISKHVATNWAGDPAVPESLAGEVCTRILERLAEKDAEAIAYRQYEIELREATIARREAEEIRKNRARVRKAEREQRRQRELAENPKADPNQAAALAEQEKLAVDPLGIGVVSRQDFANPMVRRMEEMRIREARKEAEAVGRLQPGEKIAPVRQ